MNAKLLEKIEELTLHLIEQNKKIKKLEQKEKRYDQLMERIEKLEKGDIDNK